MVFARACNIPKSTFQRYLFGKKPSEPGLDELRRIASYAGRPLEWLVTGATLAAPAMHSLLDCSILTAPERAMEDATFREAWKLVGQLWHRANPHRRKPKLEDVKKWEAFMITLRGFSPVGQSPDPAAEQPWPIAGHPLH